MATCFHECSGNSFSSLYEELPPAQNLLERWPVPAAQVPSIWSHVPDVYLSVSVRNRNQIEIHMMRI